MISINRIDYIIKDGINRL